MTKLYSANGRDYFIAFDDTARVYEMFASDTGSDCLGCFDTHTEALAYAKRHAKEVA